MNNKSQFEAVIIWHEVRVCNGPEKHRCFFRLNGIRYDTGWYASELMAERWAIHAALEMGAQVANMGDKL